MIAGLFVSKNGPYVKMYIIDPWDIKRDARKYSGPYPVIAHPPCERWGRYWNGGPSSIEIKKKGDDEGCFASALTHVRNYGGIIEHPEASHAWTWFGLRKPPQYGGWIKADLFGGITCCVAQGHYGHRAQKLTWLYGINIKIKELKWGLCPNMQKLDEGYHSKQERRRAIRTGISQRLSKNQREQTPIQFAELLISLIKNNP